MLICKNCGAKFDGIYGVCPVCGKSYEKPRSSSNPTYTTSDNSSNMKKYIIIGSFLTAAVVGMMLSWIIIVNNGYITDINGPYPGQYEDIEPSAESSEENRSAAEIASELIKKEAFGREEIQLKIWGSTDDKENIKAKIEEFESVYAIDGIEYDIHYVQIDDEDVISYLKSDADKGGDVFYFPAEEFETAVKKNLLAEVTYSFYGKIQNSNTEQAVKNCMSNDKLYAYPIVSGNESRMIGVNDESDFPFTASLFAMHLSGINLSEYK